MKPMFMKRYIVAVFAMLVLVGSAAAQQPQQAAQPQHSFTMSLEEVIETAHSQSPSAILARHNFIVNYWQFRTYKAQFLPSLNLQGNLGNYNRSLVSLQNAETGEIGYLQNNTLSNSLGLSIDQNIPFTGGSVSVVTSLNRLDQFSPTDKITYNCTDSCGKGKKKVL